MSGTEETSLCAENVKFSCVMDHHPKFARQALGWALTLLTFGRQRPESLVVHAVEGCQPRARRVLESWGITTRVVSRFETFSRNANKLSQLESVAGDTSEYVVLCDCDLVFCGNISDWITGGSIRARAPSYAGLTLHQWSRLFLVANLDMPQERVRAVLDGKQTISTYCNGALYIIPRRVLEQLRQVWPKWGRWLFRRPELVRHLPASTQQVAIDQVALSLTCAELGLPIDQLPVEVNFPVRGRPWNGVPEGLLYRMRRNYDVLVMHHHGRDQMGLLRMTATPYLNRRIVGVNRVLSCIERAEGCPQAILSLARRCLTL